VPAAPGWEICGLVVWAVAKWFHTRSVVWLGWAAAVKFVFRMWRFNGILQACRVIPGLQLSH
ncbi:MAG: hypothetical protein QHJ82_17400, partial [Verrucomicrobiota bacterium]|nr:hypothetical protein [Verrucomicrobiota bacterium]